VITENQYGRLYDANSKDLLNKSLDQEILKLKQKKILNNNAKKFNNERYPNINQLYENEETNHTAFSGSFGYRE
jgi:hypothetical protein